MSINIKQSNQNIPKLRFPGFLGEWEEKRLGEICSFEQGVQIDLNLQTKEQKDGYVKFLRIENYTQNSDDFRFVPKKSSKNKEIKNDDIVVVRYGATAGFISRGLSGVLANNLFSVRPIKKDEISVDFLYKILKQEKVFNYLQLAMSGGAMPALSFSIMRPFKIIFPSFPEQQKIAEFLGVVDGWIGNLRAQKESLEKYKKGMMQKIFNQEVRFKDENGNNFPEWEERRLGEVANFWNGKAHEQEISENGRYIVVNSKFISQNGDVRKYSDKQISPLKKNDVVIVMSDIPNGKAIGKCFLIDQDNKYTLNQRIGGIKSKEIIGPFLFRILNRNKYFLKFDNGVSQTNLRKDEILRCPVIFPSLPEQQKIVEFLTLIDNLIESKQQQITQAGQWKKGLMQGLFV